MENVVKECSWKEFETDHRGQSYTCAIIYEGRFFLFGGYCCKAIYVLDLKETFGTNQEHAFSHQGTEPPAPTSAPAKKLLAWNEVGNFKGFPSDGIWRHAAIRRSAFFDGSEAYILGVRHFSKFDLTDYSTEIFYDYETKTAPSLKEKEDALLEGATLESFYKLIGRALVYDQVKDRILTHGGSVTNNPNSKQSLELSLNEYDFSKKEWRCLYPECVDESLDPSTIPSTRSCHCAALLENNTKFVIYSGRRSDGKVLNDLWIFDLTERERERERERKWIRVREHEKVWAPKIESRVHTRCFTYRNNSIVFAGGFKQNLTETNETLLLTLTKNGNRNDNEEEEYGVEWRKLESESKPPKMQAHGFAVDFENSCQAKDGKLHAFQFGGWGTQHTCSKLFRLDFPPDSKDLSLVFFCKRFLLNCDL